jgi:hypothetical protein
MKVLANLVPGDGWWPSEVRDVTERRDCQELSRTHLCDLVRVLWMKARRRSQSIPGLEVLDA